MKLDSSQQREYWLHRAMPFIAQIFKKHGYRVPDNVNVSCGLPSKGAFSKRQAIGECWTDAASEAKKFEIFISPTISDNLEVLDTLTHELIHATAGLNCGHKGKFRHIAIAIGMKPPLRSCGAGEELKKELLTISEILGAYPHGRLNNLSNEKPTQSTRLLKAECPDCGYTIRLTKKWAAVGLPICACGQLFELVTPEHEKE